MLEPIHFLPACVAGVEIAVFGAEHAGAPVVFVTHGRGGSAVHVYDWCAELAALGFVAIALDQRNHGRRLVDQRCNDGWSPQHAADMYSNFVGTASDVSLLIDMLPACLGIATDRVGMTGGSMGGHATLIAMTLDPRIAVGAPLIGGGDYRRLMELRAAANGCPPEEFVHYFPAALQAAVEKFDPIHHPERFANRPLLLANGAEDNLVQLECNQRFVAAARPYYTDSEKLTLSIYPSIGHAIPPPMWTEAKSWLHHWLLVHHDKSPDRENPGSLQTPQLPL